MGAKTVFEGPSERRGLGFAHSPLLRRKSSSACRAFWGFLLVNIGDRCRVSWFVHRASTQIACILSLGAEVSCFKSWEISESSQEAVAIRVLVTLALLGPGAYSIATTENEQTSA